MPAQCNAYDYGAGRCPWNAVVGDERCRKHLLANRKPGTRIPFIPAQRVESEGNDAATRFPVSGQLVSSVVYYLGHPGSQLVKIGTTRELRTRLGTIRRQGWPGTVILATEPGGYELERTRHLEFRRFQAKRPGFLDREWFSKEPILMQHVNQVRRRHGVLVAGSRPVLYSMFARPRSPAQ